MLTLLIAAMVGAYASQKISVVRDGEVISVSTDYQRVWQDLIAVFTLIGSICRWLSALGRNAQRYCNESLLPWLTERGVTLKLPIVTLPALPTTVQSE